MDVSIHGYIGSLGFIPNTFIPIRNNSDLYQIFIFQVNKEKVVFFIQHYLKLLKYYGDQEILEACGRLDTNSFELRITTPDGVAKNLRAMYR